MVPYCIFIFLYFTKQVYEKNKQTEFWFVKEITSSKYAENSEVGNVSNIKVNLRNGFILNETMKYRFFLFISLFIY